VIYRFWSEFIASKVAWLACFFILASLWTIDHMLHAMRLFMAYQCGPPEGRAAVLQEEEARLGKRQHTLRLTKQYSINLSQSGAPKPFVREL